MSSSSLTMPATATAATATSTATPTTKREFIIHSQGEENYVEVSPTDTLANVRLLILEELDEEQLPCCCSLLAAAAAAAEAPASTTAVPHTQTTTMTTATATTETFQPDHQFAFRLNGIRISTKQESRKLAFDLLDSNARVELVPRINPNKRRNNYQQQQQQPRQPLMTSDNDNETTSTDNKRVKLLHANSNNYAIITPPCEKQQSRMDNGKEWRMESSAVAAGVAGAAAVTFPIVNSAAAGVIANEANNNNINDFKKESDNDANDNDNNDNNDNDDNDDDSSSAMSTIAPIQLLQQEANDNANTIATGTIKETAIEDDDYFSADEAAVLSDSDNAKEEKEEGKEEKMARNEEKDDCFHDAITADGKEGKVPHRGVAATSLDEVGEVAASLNTATDDVSFMAEIIDGDDHHNDIATSTTSESMDVDMDPSEWEENASSSDARVVYDDVASKGNNASGGGSSSSSNNNNNNKEEDILFQSTTVTATTTNSNTTEQSNNPHKEADEAKEKSHHVLDQLGTILKDNPNFCSSSRRKEWLEEIQGLKEKCAPQTIFGVLGNTGVGKSSLLNALLDEAAVLPTSGSRGCTAAVVELAFHSDLLKKVEAVDNYNANDDDSTKTIPVYKGEVEFIKLEDWEKELKVLVEECSTQEKTIYALLPREDNQLNAAAAWQKIDQVYGKGTMARYHGYQTNVVFNTLRNNYRVKKLLTATNPTRDYNSIFVEVGEVAPGSEEAEELLKPFEQMKGQTKRKKKKWAQQFRQEINTYVYRAGNGDQPQTWPLIRKVQLRGPWSVLSTGACLVDLPGVRDSNAARAKVAENYLQNCNQIAIVAPIKRAVDDGTAKELLGEQFKRRLLMDGQYGNIFFICTQTDDLEASETMQDHADVAQQVPGRWEKMSELANDLSRVASLKEDKEGEEEDLKYKIQDALDQYENSKSDFKEAHSEDSDDEVEVDAEFLDNLKTVMEADNAAYVEAKQELTKWRNENTPTIKKYQEECDRLSMLLKPICAAVRNEYSKSCLQEDFRSGLKELYRKDDDGNEEINNNVQTALPEEFNMDVFCISANDYLKSMKIKTSRDGSPNTFNNPIDTQIPLLRAFVHETTSRFCKTHAKSFVENTNDLLDHMKLLATDASNVPSARGAFRMKSTFETEVKNLDPKIQPIANNFQKALNEKIQGSLVASLQSGAQKGSAVAMSTVRSWGSKNRRTRQERTPDKNGLFWATYQAVLRRDGVYTSGCAGQVDFNQELCDPMEKEFSLDWQSVLDSTIKKLLSEAEQQIIQLCTDAIMSLASKFRDHGLDSARLSSMVNAANRSTISALKASFLRMGSTAVNSQRELSRQLLPAVQEKMKSTYEASLMVPRGPGTFDRIKGSMTTNSQQVVHSMFDGAMARLVEGIDALIKNIKGMIESTFEIISKTIQNVFSICWDSQSERADLMDPEMQAKIRECRDSLIPDLNKLCEVQVDACQLLGIAREEVELDVMAVESLEKSLERKMEEAKKKGDAFDLCDSDTEINVKPKAIRVKSEKSAVENTREMSFATQSNTEVVDLCDSDDDDDWNMLNIDWKKPSASGRTQLSSDKDNTRVKEEAWI